MLRLLQIGCERLHGPHLAGMLVRIRIIIAGDGAGRAADNAVQQRAIEIGRARPDMVALAAFVEDDLARLGIALDLGAPARRKPAGEKCGGKNENLGSHNLLLRLTVTASPLRQAGSDSGHAATYGLTHTAPYPAILSV